MTGPLAGTRVIEIGGIGPTPFAGMLLADMGAEVIRIDRPGGGLPLPLPPERDLANRGKAMVTLDLKHPDAIEALLRLVETADVVIEGFRPGVAERLGIGPDDCWRRRPALVYGRMTGWGQDGLWSQRSGHDANYISVTGALYAIGPAGGPPSVPLNLLGDYGGGSTYLVMGVLAALLRARQDGTGEVVDAAIVDGVAHLMAGVHSFAAAGEWTDERESNFLDGGAPFYGVYRTSDDRHMVAAGIEPQFFTELCELLDVRVPLERLADRRQWPSVRRLLEDAFGSRTQAHWSEVFADSDACVSPVLTVAESRTDPHLVSRGTYVDGAPAPAPRFRRSGPVVPGAPRRPGADTRSFLTAAGLDADALIASGAAVQTSVA